MDAINGRRCGGRHAHATPRQLAAEPGRSLAEQVELRAAMLYGSGYWCAESVLKSVNEAAGMPLPPGIMRLASGFCEGFGGSCCTCGALAGAVMAAGLLSGRDGPSDPWEPSYEAAGELRRRFVEDQDAATCDEVVSAIGDMGSLERWTHCTELVGRCARWVMEIAEREGWLAPESAQPSDGEECLEGE